MAIYQLADGTKVSGSLLNVGDWFRTDDGQDIQLGDAQAIQPDGERPLWQQLGMNSVQHQRLRGLGLSDDEIGSRLQAYMQRTGATQADPMNWGDDATNRVMGLPSDPAREQAQQNQIAADTAKNQALNGQTDYGLLPTAVGIAAGGTLAPWLSSLMGGGTLAGLAGSAASSGLTSTLFGGNPLTAAATSVLSGGLGKLTGIPDAIAARLTGDGGPDLATLRDLAYAGVTPTEGVPNWMQGFNTGADGISRGMQLAGGTGGAGLNGGGAMGDEVGGIGMDFAGLSPAELASIGSVSGVNGIGGGGGSALSSFMPSNLSDLLKIMQIGGIGASLLGGSNAAGAARDAASMQAGATDAASARALAAALSANDLTRQIYEQNRADIAPWRTAGATALGQLTAGTADGGRFNRPFQMSDFLMDPGYQFRLGEGNKAIERAAAAPWGNSLDSGATLKALAKYGQDFASNEFGNAYSRWNNDTSNAFNRLSGLAGTGQQASNTLANLGTNMVGSTNATNLGATTAANDALTSGANARAAGIVGGSNAWNNAISGALGGINQQVLLSQLLKAA